MSNMSRIDSFRITISPESSMSLGKWPSDMNPVSGRDILVSRNVGSDADKREHENSKDFFFACKRSQDVVTKDFDNAKVNLCQK